MDNPVVVGEITRMIWKYAPTVIIGFGSAIAGAFCFFLGVVYQKISFAKNVQNYMSTYHRQTVQRALGENEVLKARLDENRKIIEPIKTSLRASISSVRLSQGALARADREE